MKTVLIPTDFELASLDCLSEVTNRYYPEKLNIILVHMVKMTDSITELLMLSKRRVEYENITDEFKETFNDFKQNNNHLVSGIRIEFFYGNTIAAFENFLEANDVDEIINIKNYNFKLTTKNSIDPTILVKKISHKAITIDFNLIKKPYSVASKTIVEQSVIVTDKEAKPTVVLH